MASYSDSLVHTAQPYNTSYALDGEIKLPRITAMTVIGITVAIVGNILISLALNLQKLAHKRVEAEKQARVTQRLAKIQLNEAARSRGDVSSDDEDDEQIYTEGRVNIGISPVIPNIATLETQPLLPSQHGSKSPSSYGAGSGATDLQLQPNRIPKLTRFRFPLSDTSGVLDEGPHSLKPVGISPEVPTPNGSLTSGKGENDHLTTEEIWSESTYLKSKLWWLGFVLMNIGELGNFISYAFAPASLVAPLGTFALLANCLFAPLMLSEKFRKIELLGIFIAIVGAITVVLSSNTSNSRLGPDALLGAISQRPFLVYSCIYVAGASVLATLSEGEIGKTWVFVDVGLCALFGGFTVLSTKAISTLLTMVSIKMFTEWLTYPILFVLVFTGLYQVKYLNRALMRFDSKVVIPVQFVFFTLSAIIGSAILYGDFKKATFHQLVTFLYGCAATFAGVFIIAWAPSNVDKAEVTGDEVGQGMDSASLLTEDDRLPFGSLGRRRRTQFPINGARELPILRHRPSSVSIMGISPAKHLLMVCTPPREIPERRDAEHDVPQTPDSIRRRRAISWVGEDVRVGGSRDGNIGAWSRNIDRQGR